MTATMSTDQANILTTPQLQIITGYTRPADVERCLRRQGIKVFKGRCGPWTTLTLVNAAGGINEMQDANSAENELL